MFIISLAKGAVQSAACLPACPYAYAPDADAAAHLLYYPPLAARAPGESPLRSAHVDTRTDAAQFRICNPPPAVGKVRSCGGTSD